MGRVGGAASFRVFTKEETPGRPQRRQEDFVVAVVDTGVVRFADGRPHPFLDGRLADGWEDNLDSLPSPEPVTEQDGHGTFVAGVILQQAPAVTIDVRNALDPTGDDDVRVATVIRDLIEVEHLRLVNLSFFGDDLREPEVIRAALADLVKERPELLVVTAAGNGSTDDRAWPAAFSLDVEQVLAIGALDEWLVPVPGRLPPPASFTNFGLYVDAWAGGVDILGPSPRSLRNGDVVADWCRWSGTSFAAAAVTGRIAQTMLDGQLSARRAWHRLTAAAHTIPVRGTPGWLRRPYITTGGPEWTV